MTLVEMLVVLAIVGVASGAAVLGLGASDRSANIETEARRLAARIRIAADEAMVTDRTLAFVVDDGGYGFVGRDPVTGAWTPQAGEALEHHDLPAPIMLDAGAIAGPVPIGIDNGAGRLDLTLSDGRQRWSVRWDGLNASAAAARP